MKAPRAAAGSVATAFFISLLAAVPAPVAAAGAEPSLALFATKQEATAFRHGRRAALLEPVLYVGAHGGPLDLRVRRDSFAEPLELTQVVHAPGRPGRRPLSPQLLDAWGGLDAFLRIRVTDAGGKQVWSDLLTFCPNSYNRQRLDDRGPDVPTFPHGCYRSPRLLGMAWGIDEGWAVPALSFRAAKLRVPDGRYSVDVAVTRRYRELFGIAEEDAAVTLAVTVKTIEDGCSRCRKDVIPLQRSRSGGPASGVPDVSNPDPSTLPDLRVLPAFSMRLRNARNGRSYLRFAATIWVGGDAPMVVEGFRRRGEAFMDAYQYFYKNGKPVGRAPAGSFEFDERDGHHHWHMTQFVRYSMLDVDQAEAVRSKKESFCLVPTDAVDLSLDNAQRDEFRADLRTSCGGPEALWIRETVPLGWGDTYYQGVPGQAFDVTDLPNGAYWVEVAANPDGLLHEQDTTNNSALRKVFLRGTPGNRRVVVPDPYGMDGRR